MKRIGCDHKAFYAFSFFSSNFGMFPSQEIRRKDRREEGGKEEERKETKKSRKIVSKYL